LVKVHKLHLREAQSPILMDRPFLWTVHSYAPSILMAPTFVEFLFDLESTQVDRPRRWTVHAGGPTLLATRALRSREFIRQDL
jgi:hypothetical protein